MAKTQSYDATVIITRYGSTVECPECPYGRAYCCHRILPSNNKQGMCPNFQSAGSTAPGTVIVFCTREVTGV